MATLNISASLIKSLESCTTEVYYNKVQKIPSEAHWKTRIGSITHDILEIYANPRHKNIVKKSKKTKLEKIPEVKKLINRKIKEYRLENFVIQDKYDMYEDLDVLIKRALNYGISMDGAEKVYHPEYKFEFNVNGVNCKGFFDRIADYGTHIQCLDYKTQKTPFSNKELDSNVQAMLYQYAIRKLFNKKSYVSFLMLRQKETSKNFIQEVAPLPDDVLDGFEVYLNDFSEKIKSFGYKEAVQNPATKNGESWKCNYCSYKNPFKYYGCYNESGELVRTSLYEITPKSNEIVIQLDFPGCVFHQNSL